MAAKAEAVEDAARAKAAEDAAKAKATEEAAKAKATEDATKAMADNEAGQRRAAALHAVYKEFDLDRGGDVGRDEMLALGQARRKLGHKGGQWTEQQNEKLLVKMGSNNAGNVTAENFVR